VLAFGDSLTAGLITDATGAGAIDVSAAYPTQLRQMLEQRYPGQTIVVSNEGKVGETAAEGALRFPSVVFQRHPDVVLLLEGVNDIHGSIGDASIGPALDAIASMIDAARGQGAAVLVGTLPPAREGALKPGTVALIAPFDEQLADVAAAHGAVLVDLHAALLADMTDWIGPDGLHPTMAGYHELAEVFLDALVDRFQSVQRRRTIIQPGK
jgi:lysophospholipase L1-like esterase